MTKTASALRHEMLSSLLNYLHMDQSNISFVSKKYFDIEKSTLRSYLSRGFPNKQRNNLLNVCALIGQRFDAQLLINTSPRRKSAGSDSNDLNWTFFINTDSQNLGIHMAQLYADAQEYLCIRVPSPFTITKVELKIDNNRKVCGVKPQTDGRVKYLQPLWARIKNGHVSGLSINMAMTLERLVEVWAAESLVRKYKVSDKNKILILPAEFVTIRRDSRLIGLPMVGARIVDRRSCLISTPANNNDVTHFAGWIDNIQLSATMYAYANRLRDKCIDLTYFRNEEVVESHIKNEYEWLCKSGANKITEWGIIDNFDQFRELKCNMVKWADKLEWFPVIA